MSWLLDLRFLFVALCVAFVSLMTLAGYEIGKSADNSENANKIVKHNAIGGVLGAFLGIITVALVYWFWFRKQNFHLRSSSSPIFSSSDLAIMKKYGALPEQVTRRNESRL